MLPSPITGTGANECPIKKNPQLLPFRHLLLPPFLAHPVHQAHLAPLPFHLGEARVIEGRM